MQFALLGSGSRGNSVLVEHAGTNVMLDCGFSARETERRLANLGRSPQQLSAILISHEHSDHVRGVSTLARKYSIPVWMTPGSHAGCDMHADVEVQYINDYAAIEIGDIQVSPYPVPHDANEPCQFVFEDGVGKLGVLTDIGSETQEVIDALQGCNALLLECNHDEDMLSGCEYPWFLKQRILGEYGHFSNEQAAGLLQQLDTDSLQHITALHLSEKNNTEMLVRKTLSDTLNCEQDWIGVAQQDHEFQWRSLI